jgi:hypothetical protein
MPFTNVGKQRLITAIGEIPHDAIVSAILTDSSQKVRWGGYEWSQRHDVIPGGTEGADEPTPETTNDP